MISSERVGEVVVVQLGDGENAFDRTWVDSVNATLDELDAINGPKALVTTATGKFFSNGLDLTYLFSGSEDPAEFVGDIYRLFARVLSAPFPTVAAINGHAFAGGAMLALAHDRRLLREDRGFVCINEVTIGLTLAPGPWALIKARLPQQSAHIAVTAAHRFGGAGAVRACVVDDIVPEADLKNAALELAGSMAATAGPVLGRLKETMYAEALSALRKAELPPDP